MSEQTATTQEAATASNVEAMPESFKEAFDREMQSDDDAAKPDRVMDGVNPDHTVDDETSLEETEESTEQRDTEQKEADYTEALSNLHQTHLTNKARENFRNDPEASAMAAIRRDGYDRDRAKEWLAADPEGFVSYGLKRASEQAKTDRLYNQTRSRQQDGQDSAPPDEGEPNSAAPDAIDWKAVEQSIVDEHGEDAVGMLRPVGEYVQAMQSRHHQQLSELQEALSGQIVDVKLDLARNQLTEEYPGIRDNTNWEKVLQKYDTLTRGADNGYTSVFEAAHDAAHLVLGKQRRDEIIEEQVTRQRRNSDGQPTTRQRQGQERAPNEEAQSVNFLRTHGQQHGMPLM